MWLRLVLMWPSSVLLFMIAGLLFIPLLPLMLSMGFGLWTKLSREALSDLTVPLAEPTIDVFEELWQFSQVTYGFVGRI